MKESQRAYIYRVLFGLVPIAGFYGLLSEQEGSLWIGLAAIVLGTTGAGVASAFTSTKSDARP